MHKIQRSNLDEITGFLPVTSLETHKEHWPDGPPKHCTPVYREGKLDGYNMTRRDDIRNAKVYCGRLDIVIWNEGKDCKCKECGDEHTRIYQCMVFPGPNGTLRGDFEKLSPEDLEWAKAESLKLWEVSAEEPKLRAAIERNRY